MCKKETERKPCPLCGGKVISGFWNDYNLYELGCGDCGCNVQDLTINESEKTWDKRAK